jgi:hypothetical protein
MYKIQTKSLEITTETKKEAFTILLKLLGHDIASFSSYMGKTIEEVQEVPLWAENYLKDTIDLELAHLAYIIKDIKAQGLMNDYTDIVVEVKEHITNGVVKGSQPIKINLIEDGAIKSSLIVYATDILRDFIKDVKALNTSANDLES